MENERKYRVQILWKRKFRLSRGRGRERRTLNMEIKQKYGTKKISKIKIKRIFCYETGSSGENYRNEII